MSITAETRREAYYETQESAPTRRKEIYQRLLSGGPMTADTLMAAMGYINPNSVRPRLTELKQSGLVRAVGKARNRAGKNVSLWEAVPPEEIKRAAPGGNDTQDGNMENNTTVKIPQEGGEVNGQS